MVDRRTELVSLPVSVHVCMTLGIGCLAMTKPHLNDAHDTYCWTLPSYVAADKTLGSLLQTW